ncbi:hypothetical protein Tco_0854233 [Tanacetum coccineum]
MYPRFLSMVLEAKPVNTNLYLAYQFTKKIFGNMNRGFAGVYRPLLANIIARHDENQGEPQEGPVESQPPPNASVPSTSQPITEPHPDQELETKTELHGSSSDFVHTPPTQVETPSPELKSISLEPMEHTYDQPQPSPLQQLVSPEPQPTLSPKSPPLQGPTSTYAEATRINVADLLHLVPQLVTRIDNLEKELKENKQTTTAVIVKLVKKVKKLETRVKYGNLPNRKMVLSDSESEDAVNSSKQGRKLGEEDTKTYTRRVKSGLKKKLDVGVSSDGRKFKSASEEIKSGFTNISSGEVRVSQRKGKEVLEEQPQPKRSKKQIREEEETDIQEKDKNKAKNNKTEHENEKSVNRSQSQSPSQSRKIQRRVKSQNTTLGTEFAKSLKLDFKDAEERAKAKRKVKEKEPVKKMGKRRKQIARKGLHTAKDEAEKDEASEEDDSSSGTNVPINHVPVAVKTPSIASNKHHQARQERCQKIDSALKQTATGKVISNPFMTVMVCHKTIWLYQHTNVSRTVEMKRFSVNRMDMHLSGGQRTGLLQSYWLTGKENINSIKILKTMILHSQEVNTPGG